MLRVLNSEERPVRMGLAAGAFALLLACLLYNIYIVLANPNPGITYDARWEVTVIEDCDANTQLCPDDGDLQLHDRLVQVGGVSFDDYVENPNLIPFGGYGSGDVVPLTVLRDGQTMEVEWPMRPVEPATVARFVIISLLVYGAFWLAGTFVLLYMRPADLTWTLLIALFYLITIWLAVGLPASTNVAQSAHLLRIISWLMVPVMIHLHLIAPGALVSGHRRVLLPTLYLPAAMLLALQVTGVLPWFAYLGGILVAAVIGVGLLLLRLMTPRAPFEKLTARLMLVGIVLAFAPGLILSAVPLILDLGTSDIVGAVLSILALPMLPLFYTYAIYKHQLGLREHRVNRLLVQYTLFLLYLILLALVFVIMTYWIETAGEIQAMLALLLLAVFFALLPVRRPVQAVVDRLAYGTRYSRREILAEFAERIPTAVNRQDLVRLLKYELAPELEIRQSALFIRHDSSVSTVYWQGVGPDDGPRTWDETQAILDDADNLRLSYASRAELVNGRLNWIRLVVPLRVQGRPTGAWFFGRRESDSIYSQDDVDLLERLAGLVAITIESGGLFDALSRELSTREEAEARLAGQSKRLALLHEIDRAILAAGSPVEIADAAIAGVCHLLPCSRASVFLFESDKAATDRIGGAVVQGKLRVLAAQGSGTSIIAKDDTIPLTALPAHKALLQGRRFVSDDVQELVANSETASTMAPSGIRAVVSVPLMASGRVFGALSVANDEPNSYRSSHIAVVEEVATSVALAIHNARLRDAVNKNSRELQKLSARLITAQETERKRLSHELHDEMGQILTAISLSLASIERNLSPDGNDPLYGRLADANSLVNGLSDQVRSLSLELRPAMLHDLGLASTLRWYAGNYAKRRDTRIHFEIEDISGRLPENVEITAYRVVQEALTNTDRHAQASQVELHVVQNNGQIEITVEDDGCGFDPDFVLDGESVGSGIGLMMMRQRISALDGSLVVRSKPSEGTCIQATIPCGEIG
jgi:signal transduction histidine kinase